MDDPCSHLRPTPCAVRRLMDVTRLPLFNARLDGMPRPAPPAVFNATQVCRAAAWPRPRPSLARPAPAATRELACGRASCRFVPAHACTLTWVSSPRLGRGLRPQRPGCRLSARSHAACRCAIVPATQRLFLEGQVEVLHCDWAFKVAAAAWWGAGEMPPCWPASSWTPLGEGGQARARGRSRPALRRACLAVSLVAASPWGTHAPRPAPPSAQAGAIVDELVRPRRRGAAAGRAAAAGSGGGDSGGDDELGDSPARSVSSSRARAHGGGAA